MSVSKNLIKAKFLNFFFFFLNLIQITHSAERPSTMYHKIIQSLYYKPINANKLNVYSQINNLSMGTVSQ